MKIDENITKALESLFAKRGSIAKFSLETGYSNNTINRWKFSKSKSINENCWERLYPYLYLDLPHKARYKPRWELESFWTEHHKKHKVQNT